MSGTSAETRKAFSQALCDLAAKDDRIVGLGADLGYIISEFMEKYPERFINVGIAEPNMVGVASGLALSGMIPFATTISAFLSLRACEQVRTDVCYAKANVKLVGTGGGTSYASLGNTHMGLEDLAVVNSFANMVVLSPADGIETAEAVKAAAAYEGPVYIRIGHGENPMIYEEGYKYGGKALKYEIGQANTLRQGKDITLIATGCIIVANALAAADLLAKEGISARVIDMHTVKPLDEAAIIGAARETKGIVVIEDHQTKGGLGAAVAQVTAAEAPAYVKCLGIPNVFVPLASQDELFRRYGLDAPGIAKTAAGMMKR